MRALIVLAAVVGLIGCAFNARVLPMNDAALGAPVATFEYVRQGVTHGPVTLTMASGEVLTGEWQVVQNAAIGFGFGGGGSATAIGFGGGEPVTITAVSPAGTILNCQGESSFGHGSGVCETNRGGRYRVNF